ncbi:hypothetical protein BGZ46_003920 [Entomortierella lignicola]|nr:hypothetical protein BGZ46_003920 [Entomortierella lignicola]
MDSLYSSSLPSSPSTAINSTNTISTTTTTLSLFLDSNPQLATTLSLPPIPPSPPPLQPTLPSRISVRARSNPSALLVFFILLSLNCLFPSSSFITPLLFILPCQASSTPNSLNQRVDVPSSQDFPPLTGPEYNYTQNTPLGNLVDASDYATGALATQKLVSAPIIPIDRQSWVGIDTRTVYFGNDYGVDKISSVPNLLQAGMRRLVIDLWWDAAAMGWQLCPRLNRDTSQMSTVRLALEQEQKDLETSLQLQDMGGHQIIGQEIQKEFEELQPSSSPPTIATASNTTNTTASTTTTTVITTITAATTTITTTATATTATTINITESEHPDNEQPQLRRINNNPGHNDGMTLVKRGAPNSEKPVLDNKHSESASQQIIKPNQDSNNVKPDPPNSPNRNRTHPNSHEWFRKKNPQLPPIKLKDMAADQAQLDTDSNKLASAPTDDPTHEHHGRLHRLSLNAGKVSSYNKTKSVDQTSDGITCTTGEDLIVLLQGLQTWVHQTTGTEFEDVLLLILNLNEIGNTTLGSRPSSSPSNSTTAASTDNPNNTLAINNDDFFKSLVSPNTNKTVKALLPSTISLKELFTDAFPSSIYSPTLLQMERADLKANWWKSGRVGLDYYNTTFDVTTRKLTAPTGWPTSSYLTDVIKRRVVVGFGSINLSANTTYNVTDDFTTFYAPGTLGLSMSNSSLIQITPSFTTEQCDNPMPGILMTPTGSEGSMNVSDPSSITTELTWSFSSMSDTDSLPWTYSSGQSATTCGFSPLLEGRAPVLTYSEHTAMTIWSWDLDQPPINQTRSRDRRCGVMQSNGRWAAQDCNSKLPVACREINTSGNWIIYEKGSANYRDVSCPDGYRFDVPRTAHENQLLYSTLLSFWNSTVPSAFASTSQKHRLSTRSTIHADDGDLSRYMIYDHDDEDDNNEDEDDYYEDEDDTGDEESEVKKSRPMSLSPSSDSETGSSRPKNNGKEGSMARQPIKTLSPPTTLAGLPGGGMIWIDISSWQTAGCWVSGGVDGICPYQDPDNTVALQEIIKVSIIGGVIILVVLAIFLYLNCRRNVRIRKSNKRRAAVRNKIMRTEVETVPA